MAAAGYDPRAAIDLWDLMAAVEADAARHGESPSLEDRLTLLRTHPTSHARQEAIARLMPKALGVYEESMKRGGPLAKKAQASGPVKAHLSRPVSAAEASAVSAEANESEGSQQTATSKNPLGLPPRRQKKEATGAQASASASAAARTTYHASLQTSTNFLPLGSRTHVKPAVPLREVSLTDEDKNRAQKPDQAFTDSSTKQSAESSKSNTAQEGADEAVQDEANLRLV